MWWRPIYAAAFGFRQARVYTTGRGQCVCGRRAEPLPSPAGGAFLTIPPFQRDSGNLREKPTVFFAGRRCELKHFWFRKNAAPAPAKIQGRVDRTIPRLRLVAMRAFAVLSKMHGTVMEDHPPENKRWHAGHAVSSDSWNRCSLAALGASHSDEREQRLGERQHVVHAFPRI
jgi:hypothetical protein